MYQIEIQVEDQDWEGLPCWTTKKLGTAETLEAALNQIAAHNPKYLEADAWHTPTWKPTLEGQNLFTRAGACYQIRAA